jgi:hypothetical protein
LWSLSVARLAAQAHCSPRLRTPFHPIGVGPRPAPNSR